ncbi:MAG: metalloregulator ArsR/SmtB family transcription factor [Ilumatobacteraceae bacterium]
MAHSDRLDAAFAALADPTRRAIIARLTLGEASVTELARPFAMSQPAISKHLKVLERAGLVSRRRDAQRRPCRLNAPALRDATEWLDGYRQFWAESYERLDELLAELQSPADATDHHERGTDSGAENRAEEGAGS